MKFSERIGKKAPKEVIQIDSMDAELKNSLWNVILAFVIDPMRKVQWLDYSEYKNLVELIWFSFFKEPSDQIPLSTESVASELRKRFFRWDYLQVYDFVDFLASMKPSLNVNEFIQTTNYVLKTELSGYRFVNGQLTPLTSETEISQIEKALSSTGTDKLIWVHTHLSEALNKLSDRKGPDYRNSIKESISAVESLCQIITGERKTELGKALKILKDRLPIHGALEQGFIKIYGYASDGDGIRHALLEESNLDQEDALFMLISCSAFVNYLLVKSTKAGLKLT